ncbi:MAG: AlpA family phage regulatory protein [Betaproteobacteria bacterium]|nr:AlpA family phage regulatory protein [Betaproteobacteria bacterium]
MLQKEYWCTESQLVTGNNCPKKWCFLLQHASKQSALAQYVAQKERFAQFCYSFKSRSGVTGSTSSNFISHKSTYIQPALSESELNQTEAVLNKTQAKSTRGPLEFDRPIRAAQVVDLLGISQSTLYQLIADGSFPRPFRLIGGRATAWRTEPPPIFLDTNLGLNRV